MLQQWSLNTRYNLSRTLSLDLGYVGTNGDHLLLSQGLNQPLLASPGNPVNCGYDGIATDCITQNTSSNAYERVPILGETPTALADNNFTGRSWYESPQATLSEQLSRGLTFRVAYTFSKAENNTVLYPDGSERISPLTGLGPHSTVLTASSPTMITNCLRSRVQRDSRVPC